MKLTVAIIYCDKDWKYVPELVEDVRKKVAMRHEIVLVDNTTEGTPIEADKYFWMGGNKYATQGRKKAVELAEGDYVWFVDADDEILPMKEPPGDEDMYLYGYEIVGWKDPFISLAESEFSVEGEWILNRPTYEYYGWTLWNKLIRTSILRDVESLIPDDWLCVAGEDVVLYTGCYVRCRTIRFMPDMAYRFRADRSFSGNTRMTLDKFRHILDGCKESMELMKRICGEKMFPLGFDDDYTRDIGFYLCRMEDAVDETEGKKMMSYLLAYFGEDKVLRVLDKNYNETAQIRDYLPEQLVEEEKEQ